MSAVKAVLIVDDEVPILRFLRASLGEAGFQVLEARTGSAALELAAARKPDVVLLDLGLPDMDGLEALKRLRQWTAAPVIILSARGRETDKIAGLDAGADDYLTKPFGVPELMARIRVALRHAERPSPEAEPVYRHGELVVDLAARRVLLSKKELRLSPRQYDLLAALARRAGRVARQSELIMDVWGAEAESSPEALRILVHQLRHRLERDPVRPRHLKTEPGVGYRLEAPEP
ncbi:MAG: response regulator [Elusimicrobia bacterium]|nr:response regulator [Elusimicrobiota bacterium]